MILLTGTLHKRFIVLAIVLALIALSLTIAAFYGTADRALVVRMWVGALALVGVSLLAIRAGRGKDGGL